MGLELLLPDLHTVMMTLLLGLLAAVILTPLEYLYPAQPIERPIRKELALDFIYWFSTPLLSRTLTGLIIGGGILGAVKIFGVSIDIESVLEGRGFFGNHPHWLQAIEILLLADLADYWTHRTLHRSSLWPIHAIHHSPEQMTWMSSARVHPLNDLVTRAGQISVLVLFGFSAEAILKVIPFISFYVMFLHSNLSWDFGPLRWVLVSPAYHRWHHTTDLEGIDKNYAGIFPIWDVLFGTQHFPKRLPERYGLLDDELPESFVAHILFPFKRSSYARKPSPNIQSTVVDGVSNGTAPATFDQAQTTPRIPSTSRSASAALRPS